MKPIWSMLYDNAKDRRYGVLFLFAPLALVGAVALAVGLLTLLDVAGLLPYALCGIALWFVWMVVKLVCKVVRLFCEPERQREGWQRHELSCNEKRVAQSKLKSGMNKFKSVKPVSRPLDLDLKM
jgi:hypothetical protein